MIKKICLLVLFACVLLGGIAGYQYLQFHDGKLHVIFCDVGQGDGILIKAPNEKLIMVDSGPDRKILDCLSRHTPFWVRTIDLAALTHPHADHFFGMFFVLKQYHVTTFATEDLMNKTAGFEELMGEVTSQKIKQERVFAGDNWQIGDVKLEIVGPSPEYLTQTSPGGTIGESKEFASLITLLTYGTFHLLLTGDSQTDGLKLVLGEIPKNIDVLQSPHHGSASGIDDELVSVLDPHIAVISVGAKNRYGHPNPKVLQIYKDHDIPVYRTDQMGDIEIVSDGEKWKIY